SEPRRLARSPTHFHRCRRTGLTPRARVEQVRRANAAGVAAQEIRAEPPRFSACHAGGPMKRNKRSFRQGRALAAEASVEPPVDNRRLAANVRGAPKCVPLKGLPKLNA